MKISVLKGKIKLIYLNIVALLIVTLKPEKLNISSKKIAFIMFAANYDNLGDIAITKAQKIFLEKNLPNDYEIVLLPVEKTFHVYRSMKKLINEDTIITLIGGGNSGTLYEFIEWPRRFVLSKFKKCRIISFPQSVYYGTDPIDEVYRNEFVNICKKCDNLTLIAREQQSYDIYKRMFGNHIEILLTPDIVFSLKEDANIIRKGVSLILREDMEKILTKETENKLRQYCEKKYTEITFDDTCNIHISGDGFSDLENFISNLKRKELVITDRLHGMILAYITNTPCIAFDNNNHKIKSTYITWLAKNGKTVFLNENESLDNVIFSNNVVELDKYFEPIKNALLK